MKAKSNEDVLSEIMSLDTTQAIRDFEGQQMGLLWNLSSERENLAKLDHHLGKLEALFTVPWRASSSNFV